MFEPMRIQSHTGPYQVEFATDLLERVEELQLGTPHFLIDATIARLYAKPLERLLSDPRTILIEANEENKSIDRIIPVIERLVANSIRRDHHLLAIGGGVIQDIACFIASTLLRGIEWRFVPTTLLAQADSCIGSKSSINLGRVKNILGTFNPPRHIWICPTFLDTLDEKEIHSGIGEIIKVHAIAGPETFVKLGPDFERMMRDRPWLLTCIREALRIKQGYIERDEFDRNERLVFNYGHSFGHAIETASRFAIPHGVAVTMGMDLANRIAVLRGLAPESAYQRMHGALHWNYRAFLEVPIQVDPLLSALMKDKKNTATNLMLILPVGDEARISRMAVTPDATFREQCEQTLKEMRG
ncbi:MAG: hypothetical protein H7834_11440 [Magnetococcus sp. YQC-9]